MNLNTSPLMLFFTSVFINNILLSDFLGACWTTSFSGQADKVNKLGIAVIFTSVTTVIFNWFVFNFILIPLELDYLKFIVFIVNISWLTGIITMTIKAFYPALYASFGVYLPLTSLNCAVFGITLFMTANNYNIMQSIAYALGSSIGWWIVTCALAVIRKRTQTAPVPAGLKGPGIMLISAGIMAMAFCGFTGIING